jgi:hypothetical protein
MQFEEVIALKQAQRPLKEKKNPLVSGFFENHI